MKIKIFTSVLILFSISFLYAQDKEVRIKLVNKLGFERTDSYVMLPFSVIRKKNISLNPERLKIADGNKEIPYQLEVNEKGDLYISLAADFKPNEIKSVVISDAGRTQSFKSRTYAELAMKSNPRFDGKRTHGTSFENVKEIKVPDWHIDHDGLFKYEGPGWESEKVGYRFYLDWRNATDIFGKKLNQLVLKNVGAKDSIADNNESYHSMQEWGMDIFKVGNSLGIGAFGTMNSGKLLMVSKTDSIKFTILMNGPVKSEIRTSYYGWPADGKKINLEARYSITAGSRLTKATIAFKGKINNIATGLVKYNGTNFHKGKSGKGWSYIALYGKQSLAGDNLGIALFYRVEDLLEVTEDSLNHLVVLKPAGGKSEYYFCAAWEKEQGGITNENDFIKYLDKTADELNHPVVIGK